MRHGRQQRLSSGPYMHMHTHTCAHAHTSAPAHTRERHEQEDECNSLKVRYEPGVVAHISIPHTQEGRTDEDLRSVWATQEDPGFRRETPSQLDIYGERQEVQQTNSHLESNSS